MTKRLFASAALPSASVFLAAALLAAMVFSSGCGAGETQYQAEFLNLFDTATALVGYGKTKAEFTALAEDVHARLEEYHKLYDIYNDYDGIVNLKTVNDNAGKAPLQVDARIIGLLRFAKEQTAASGGAFNVCYGAVLQLWHQCRKAALEDPAHARLPDELALAQAARHAAIDDLIIDEAASTVFLRDPLMRLDVGAVAKGYAVEQVAQSLAADGVQHLLLSVGGNVRAIGGKPAGGADVPWQVGIRNPDAAAEDPELMTVSVTGTSVVTSGSYGRYFTVEGKRYGHIIDPATHVPADRYAAVTVLHPDSGLADVLSTVLFNQTPAQGAATVAAIPGAEALWVYPDGALEMTDGFAAAAGRQRSAHRLDKPAAAVL